jgi:hypothetical protein
MENPKSYPEAVTLMSEAIGTAARVHPEPSRHVRDDQVFQVEVQGASGQSARLRFVSWEGPPTDTSRKERIWVVRRGGRELHERLRKRGENFVDLSGAVRLQLPWLLVDRTDLKPVRALAKSQTRNPFSDRGSLILRTMFEAGPAAEWGVKELAEASGVSVALSSYVTSALERHGLIEGETSGRAKRMRLTRPTAALEVWTRRYDWTRNAAVTFHSPVGSVERFVTRLPGVLEGRTWALTGQAGASLVAPHATWDRIHVYVDANDEDGLLELGHALGWTPGEGGRLVLMAPYYAASVWHGLQTLQELSVVSVLQLVLDLWHYPARGREQAEHLLSHLLSSRGWDG